MVLVNIYHVAKEKWPKDFKLNFVKKEKEVLENDEYLYIYSMLYWGLKICKWIIIFCVFDFLQNSEARTMLQTFFFSLCHLHEILI